MAKKKSPARLDREIAQALGKSGKLWPVTDPDVQRARDAERKLAEIARTRRPTEAESASATSAYAAAAKAAAKKEKVCRYCDQKLHWEGDHFECGGEGEGACSFWGAIGDYDRAGRPKDVEGWLDGWIQGEVGTDWKGMGWDRGKHAKAIRDYFKLPSVAHATRRSDELVSHDGTRNARGQLLARIARARPAGLSVERTPDVVFLVERGYVRHGLHPSGGYRADVTDAGLAALADT